MNTCTLCGKEHDGGQYVCEVCNGESKDLKLRDWFKQALIFLIPIYGWFIHIFVLASSKKTNPNLRNWARAYVLLIGICFVIILLVVLLMLLPVLLAA